MVLLRLASNCDAAVLLRPPAADCVDCTTAPRGLYYKKRMNLEEIRMTKRSIEQMAREFLDTSPANRFAADAPPPWPGRRLFDPPLVGVADADDALWQSLRRPEVVGEHALPPAEWLPGARSVVSLFLPFTREVRASNRREKTRASTAWLYGRIEGQACIDALLRHLVQRLGDAGEQAVAPGIHPRFEQVARRDAKGNSYGCANWSERHVAYIAGLGTFGLSRGLITAKGMAGRLGSLVLCAPLAPTARAYAQLYDYCTRCGACIRRCPAGAITREGKQHGPCAAILRASMQRDAPRYGCGKCQTGVPCEAGIPARKDKRRI